MAHSPIECYKYISPWPPWWSRVYDSYIQPPGFIDSSVHHYVCLLKNSFSLKQAPPAWYQWFASYVATLRFIASISNTVAPLCWWVLSKLFLKKKRYFQNCTIQKQLLLKKTASDLYPFGWLLFFFLKKNNSQKPNGRSIAEYHSALCL